MDKQIKKLKSERYISICVEQGNIELSKQKAYSVIAKRILNKKSWERAKWECV